MADESSWLNKVNAVLEKPVGMVQAVVNFFMRDGTLAALGREAIKDVGDTFHAAAWGNSGHGRDPGGPLMPLFVDIKEGREHYSQPEDAKMSLPSPSEIARGDSKSSATVHGHGHEASQSHTPSPSEIAKGTMHGRTDGGREVAENEKTWVEKELEREKNKSNSGSDESGPFQARILPDEQREKDKDNSRGR